MQSIWLRDLSMEDSMRMRHRVMAVALGLLGTMLFASSASAQRNGGFASAPAGRPAGMNAAPIGSALPRGGPVRGHMVRVRRARRAFGGSAYGPNYYPNYYPDYYSDYDSDEGYVAPPPAQIILQAAATPAPATLQVKPPESLVVELRGDHWVRLTGYGASEIGGQSTALEPSPQAAARSVQEPAVLPPAVLVFRDGHQEEAAKYTIVGKTINIKTDYWTSGSWTRTVLIAQLDLPATLKANQERGANFRLPSRPSEVIIRP